ncbi:DUF11 domain-containing protein [Candidatus Saccharibacteria bacterium]|nr:DUF11 domain-containing protein [Candidatus Saccharibacteria bacterium]MBI3338465.1 DUF11 domain-containing protein [Candidatus Saccharibacteria bacterium]
MKKLFSRLFSKLPKRVAAAALIGLAVMLPVSSIAAETVQIEGAIGVANVTAGDTKYVSDVNAKYDEVVKVEVYYHNMEDENSGKIAENLKVKIDMPTAAGTTQVIRETTSADNSNTIQKSATVHLNRADATLEYIPGSAVWKHNVGTNAAPNYQEVKISDDIVTSGQGLVLENEKPCYNFSATVTVLARVKVPSVGIVKKVRLAGSTGATTTNLSANAGDRLEYVVTASNLGNETLSNVYLRDPLPNGLSYVSGTVKKYYGTFKGTVMTADEETAFFTGKKNIGSLGPGASAFITFEANIASTDKLACGVNTLKNTAVVDTDQTGEYNNTATVTANKACQNTSVVSCDLLDITKGDNKTVNISQFKVAATNGATFKDAVVDWGDSTAMLTTNTPVGKSHQYSSDGPFNVSAKARFTVNGKEQVVTSGACAKSVGFGSTTSTTPTVLPNTGAGDVVGLFLATSVVGAFAHRLFAARRFARDL